jgi:predicted negative regulator of RcsB-dependent stress response
MGSRALIATFVLLLNLSAFAQTFGNNGSTQALAAAGAPNVNSISGLIRTSDGRPAKDARIEIRDPRTGQTVTSTYANASGSFEVNVPKGIYEVVGQLGLEETRETVAAAAGDIMVSLRLPGEAAPQSGDRFSVSVAQMKVPEKARKAFKKAEAAMQKQKIEEASKYVGDALGIYADYSEALTLRGILNLDANKLEEALADLKRAVECDSNYSLAYLAMGATYNALSRFDDALRVLDRGLGLSPTSWQGYFERGKAFLGKANYDAAIRQLNRAQDLNSKYSLIYLVKAHALLGMKNYPEAMAELESYLEHNPQGPDSAQARQTLEKVRGFAATVPK